MGARKLPCALRKNREYSKLIFPIKLLAAVIVIWALFAHGMLDLAVLHIAAASLAMLVAVSSLVSVTYLISAYRWRLLLKCQGISIPVHAATSITFLGLFLNSFLPGGGVGGEAVRVAYLVKKLSAKKTVAALSVVVDRLLGFYAMLLVAFAVALLNPVGFQGDGLLHYLAVFAAMLCLGMPTGLYLFYVLLKSNRRLRWFKDAVPNGAVTHAVYRLFDILRLYRNAPGTLLAALGLSVFIHTIALICIVIIGRLMFQGYLASVDYAFAAPWAWLANLLPATPGGLGVGEAAFDRICHLLETAQSVAAYGSVFLIYRLTTILATIPGLAVYLVHHDTSPSLSRSSGSI